MPIPWLLGVALLRMPGIWAPGAPWRRAVEHLVRSRELRLGIMSLSIVHSFALSAGGSIP